MQACAVVLRVLRFSGCGHAAVGSASESLPPGAAIRGSISLLNICVLHPHHPVIDACAMVLLTGTKEGGETEDDLEIGVEKTADRSTPRPNFSHATKSMLALASALLLVFYLTIQISHLHLSPLSASTRGLQHDTPNSDRSRLHPADHIFRNTTKISQTWRITTGLRRPDGVLKQVYLINGDFPGPTLEARSGDTISVLVENGLEEDGIAIHFHGLYLRGANEMDGAVGLTQDPVPPGESFTYQFTVDPEQHGTFWYHAHEGVQRADGLFGGLVIHKPSTDGRSEEPADERLFLAGDWYHRSAKDALQFYMHPGAFGLETVPDSILLNGHGTFNCADAVPARPLDCKTLEKNVISAYLNGSRPTILRVVNVGAYAGIQIAVSDATITPLTVDSGHALAGRVSRSVGFIHPGERVAMLVELDSQANLKESRVQITLDDSVFKYENSALSASHSWPIVWTNRQSEGHTSTAADQNFDIQLSESLNDQSKVLPDHADQTILLYAITQKLAHLDNEPRGFINSSTFVPQTPPLIRTLREGQTQNQLTIHIPFYQTSPIWVDIILNNLDEDSHPFHLHGHDFWVLARHSSSYNWGSYNPYEDDLPPGGEYNLSGAVRRDTVLVPRRGYAVLRFRADNPGIWAFHCHVLWHEASGMATALDLR